MHLIRNAMDHGIVDINGLKYAIPNHEILETRRILSNQIKQNGGRSFISFRETFIPCIDLRSKMVKCPMEFEERVREAAIIIFSNSDRHFAARVSYLEKNTELIVKPLSELGPNIPFITGVSVLPTGEPIFVLSVSQLSEDFSEKENHESAS